MKYDSIPYRILRHFALNPGLHRAVTIGELFTAINAKPGTAVHQRMTLDVIGKGWPIHKTPDHRYWMKVADARKAKSFTGRVARANIRYVSSVAFAEGVRLARKFA